MERYWVAIESLVGNVRCHSNKEDRVTLSTLWQVIRLPSVSVTWLTWSTRRLVTPFLTCSWWRWYWKREAGQCRTGTRNTGTCPTDLWRYESSRTDNSYNACYRVSLLLCINIVHDYYSKIRVSPGHIVIIGALNKGPFGMDYRERERGSHARGVHPTQDTSRTRTARVKQEEKTDLRIMRERKKQT